MSILFAAALATAMPNFSADQQRSLKAACQAGDRYGLCLEFMATVNYESSACADKINEQDPLSLGCGQIRQIAACDVDSRYCEEEMEPQRFRDLMLSDDKENMRLSSKYLAKCRDHYRFRKPASMWVCYAIGPTAADKLTTRQRASHPYAIAMKGSLLKVQRWYKPKKK